MSSSTARLVAVSRRASGDATLLGRRGATPKGDIGTGENGGAAGASSPPRGCGPPWLAPSTRRASRSRSRLLAPRTIVSERRSRSNDSRRHATEEDWLPLSSMSRLQRLVTPSFLCGLQRLGKSGC